ncbi:hypothetical protein [Streptomyces prunicolor]|uniref:hypothetical protein n=1 Tax=Streptomyces prunicolor TaxID=67348 RepID=UPI0003612070|nr:hypothetical protein [Streptomyces prunicolor]
MSDDVTITVSVNNRTAAGFRDINGQLRTLDGRFAATGNNVRRSSSMMERGMVDLKASLLSLAPAAVPVAASLAPIAVHAGGAGLAVAAFGAALKPQITNLSEAAKAQTKYSDAVAKYGQHSSQAAAAQVEAAQALKGMPAATQQAAAGYSNLQDKFTSFSDSTARFTMAPVEHSFAVLGAIVPKLTPMVAASSTQLDRLMKVAGGAVNSSGFDSLSNKVDDYANKSLKGAVDGTIHFIRVLSEGDAHGPIAEFMDYARTQGPAVKELLSNLMQALGNIAQGAADAGPGLLTIVNAFAKLVAAVPPELIGNLMQVYAAFKLIKLAGAGIGAAAGGIQALGVKIAALRTASVAAGGGLAGLKAAFLSLGVAARASVIVAGIAALVLVVSKLSNIGKSAPPDVDKLTSSLARLGATGQVTGEAASKFGTHFEKLKSQMDKVLNPAVSESVNNWGHSISGGLLKGGDATEALTGSFKAIDESLAGLVKGDKAKLAAVALKDMLKTMDPAQVKKLQGSLGEYKSALADQASEARLTAQSQGLFGQAAQDTAAKLDAQKSSADGLRGAIQALNDVNRAGLGGMIGFEAAIDSAAKAAKDNAGSLSMNNGVLDTNSAKAQAAATALQDLADKTDAAGTSQRAANASWDTVNGIYDRGRAALIKNGEAMGLTTEQAKALARQLLTIPTDTTPKIQMDTEDAKRDITAFNAAVKKTPDTKSVTLKALSKSGEQVLESFGLKVQRLPDGSVKVTTKGSALSSIKNIAAALRALNGKAATTWTYNNKVNTTYSVAKSVSGGKSVHDMVGATGGLYTGKGSGFRYADGGPVRGPGTGTSDDVPAPWLSNGEFVVKKAAVDKYGEHFLQRINDGQFEGPRFAKGGKVSQAEKDARSSLRGSFGISSFGRTAGYVRTPFEHGLAAPTDINSLVSSLNDAAGKIKGAFSGKTESNLLKHLSSVGKALIGQEKALTKVTASLATAKSKLDDLKNSASQMADGVKSGLMSSANITQGASGSTVTVASIMGGLTASRDKTTAFDDALKDLKSKGLDKGLIQQIAEAGVGGGGLETAGALLGASGSEISSMNQLQAQIATAATSAGKTTADAYYGAAIKAQDKLVKSLTSQQSKLEKSMNSLAKTMEKFITKALKGKAAGGIVGAAASGGIRSGLTLVGEQGMELADLPVGSRVWSNPDTRRKLAAAQAPWASMLNTPRRGPAAATAPIGASGGTDRPIVIQLAIGKQQFGEVWVDVGREQVRARGSIEATLKPPRGR